MENESRIKDKIIEKILIGMSICFLSIVFLVQAYIFFANKNSNLSVNNLNASEGLVVKQIDIVPNYGELIIEANENSGDNLVIRLNGQEQSFERRMIKLFVKDGDCIEINNQKSKQDYVLKIKDISNNIKNIDEITIKVSNKSDELFVVNLE